MPSALRWFYHLFNILGCMFAIKDTTASGRGKFCLQTAVDYERLLHFENSTELQSFLKRNVVPSPFILLILRLNSFTKTWISP